MGHHLSFTSPELQIITLPLLQGNPVYPAFIVDIVELNWIFLPNANRTNHVGTILKCLIAATRTWKTLYSKKYATEPAFKRYCSINTSSP